MGSRNFCESDVMVYVREQSAALTSYTVLAGLGGRGCMKGCLGFCAVGLVLILGEG